MDKFEVNFRLMLLSQRETNGKLAGVATQTAQVAAQMGQVSAALAALANQVKEVAHQVTDVSNQLTEVAQKGDETADRLEEAIGIMGSFADGQAEIRATLADYGRRLDALEGKKAS